MAPADTPVARPVVALMVAMAGLALAHPDDTQALAVCPKASEALAVNWLVAPIGTPTPVGSTVMEVARNGMVTCASLDGSDSCGLQATQKDVTT